MEWCMRKRACVLSVGMCMVFVGSSFAGVWGDMDGDTGVELADAIIAMGVVSGAATSGAYGDGEDIDGDGLIGNAEAIFILQLVAGIRPASCTITAAAGDHGTVSPSGEVTVPVGSDRVFSIAADPGYHILDVLVDGVSVGPVTGFTMTGITSGRSISATFAAVPTGLYDDFGPGDLDPVLWHGGEDPPGVTSGALDYAVSSSGSRSVTAGATGYACVEADFKVVSATGNTWLNLSARWFRSASGTRIVRIGIQTDASAADATVRAEVLAADTLTRLWSREVPLTAVGEFVRLKVGYNADVARVEFQQDDTLYASYPVGSVTALTAPEFGTFGIDGGASTGTAQYFIDNVYADTTYAVRNAYTGEVYVDPAASAPHLGSAAHPVRTIQVGLALVRVDTGGGTVHVAPGIYPEHVYVDRTRGWEDLTAVLVKGEAGAVIEGGGTGIGIRVKGIDEVNLDGLTVRNCTTGIDYTDDAAAGDISGCTVTGNAGTGIRLYATGAVVADCIVTGNGGRGIELISGTPAGSMYVYRCTVRGNGGTGVYTELLSGGSLQLYDSLITGNNAAASDSTGGVYIHNRCRVVNNTISDNGNGGGLSINTGAADLVMVFNNIITGHGGVGFEMGAGTLTLDANDVWNNAPDFVNVDDPYATGLTNFSQNPGFAGGGDYHLTPSSPCIGASTSDTTRSSEYDFEGDDRAQGTKVDVGADETPWEPIVCTEIGPVPDTGDEYRYPTLAGEDSDYCINPRSYTKLDADGDELPDTAAAWSMVRDNVTGLIWEVKTDDGGIHDREAVYGWQDALDVFIPQLNTDQFGGRSDWRMPTIYELSTLSHLGSRSPAIDTGYFPHTRATHYWSSTAYPHWTDSYAWAVTSDDGIVYNSYNKASVYGVRAVRGGQPSPVLVDNGDGTVTDTRSGLMWEQAEPGDMTWSGAIDYCETLDLAGHDDWRLPSLNELLSIVDYERTSPAMDTTAFPDAGTNVLWSSSSLDGNPGAGWFVNFSTGRTDYSDNAMGKSTRYHVRAVRSLR